MQFNLSLNRFLTLATIVALGASTPVTDSASSIMTPEELRHWLATTDAKISFVGEPINALSALITTVTYCNRRIFNVCGGDCTVYTGGATCLNAPDTECLGATHNVGFCSSRGCNGACNQLSTCGTRMDNGFCWTPNTASIAVTNA